MRVPPLASLGCLLFILTSCTRPVVAHRQPEREANTILVRLASSGIEGRKVLSGGRDLRFDISVPASEFTKSLSVLERARLPVQARIDSAQVYAEVGMVPTPEQARAQREVAVEGDLTRSLRALPGVLDAEVVVSLGEPRARASVVLLRSDQPGLDDAHVRAFVAAKLPRTASVAVVSAPPPALLPLAERASPERPWVGFGVGSALFASVCTGSAAWFVRRNRARRADA